MKAHSGKIHKPICPPLSLFFRTGSVSKDVAIYTYVSVSVMSAGVFLFEVVPLEFNKLFNARQH